MGWQEEVVANMQSEKTAIEARNNCRKKMMFDLWDKFKTANEALIPELKMKEERSLRDFVEYYWLTHQGYSIRLSISIAPTGGLTCYFIECVNSKGRLYLSFYNEEGDILIYSDYSGTIYFEINSDTPSIIIKNLCMNTNHPSHGLQVTKDPRNKTTTGGCFIATAAMGSPLVQEVLILSRFRDEILINNFFGKWFVKSYYFLSPCVAALIIKNIKLQKITAKYFIKPLSRAIAKVLIH